MSNVTASWPGTGKNDRGIISDNKIIVVLVFYGIYVLIEKNLNIQREKSCWVIG